MSSDGAVLRTRELAKQFGNFTALRPLSIDVRRGDALTLFGRNGAGKTTFLKIVSTLIRSYRGEVSLFGIPLRDADDALRSRVGLVSHESLLYGDLSARDNLVFYGRLYGLAEPATRAAQMLVDMDLETKAASPVRELSRGMKQRLALARAFLHEPELLLLDEPFTGLDERAAEILDGRIGRFAAEGGTVIMATHNVERGWKHARRVAVLDRGNLVFESSVDEMSYDEFRQKYREILSS